MAKPPKRTNRFGVYFTDDETKQLNALSADAGVTPNMFLRMLLKERSKSTSAAKVIKKSSPFKGPLAGYTEFGLNKLIKWLLLPQEQVYYSCKSHGRAAHLAAMAEARRREDEGEVVFWMDWDESGEGNHQGPVYSAALHPLAQAIDETEEGEEDEE